MEFYVCKVLLDRIFRECGLSIHIEGNCQRINSCTVCADTGGREFIKQQSSVGEIPNSLRVELRDTESAMWLMDAQPFMGQLHERLTQGWAAYADLSGECHFAELLPRGKLAEDDGTADLLNGHLTATRWDGLKRGH